tara:strand:+ start:68181 stop:68456 length:276 start_codon:yes stop_codon:yes gene_type:complete
MKFKKLILPIIAIVFAIGMAFATVDTKSSSDPDNDYVQTDSGVVTIDEIDCGAGNVNCMARLIEGEPAYPVFDDPALNTRKTGSGSVIELY